MYAVEFQAPIENGVVHIPKQYQDIQDTKKATFVVMYESVNTPNKKDEDIQNQLDKFHRLIGKSNNKVMATYELATNTDEMVEDGIL